VSEPKTKKRQDGNPDASSKRAIDMKDSSTLIREGQTPISGQDPANPSLKEGEPGELHVADKTYTFIRRYVSLSHPQATIIATWVLHAHCFEAAQTTPYLNISSAEKQSGKSTLLDALNLLVAKPWKTGKVTAAALYRMIDHRQPTLLFDETDATFGGDKEFAEALRGVFNLGHSAGSPVSVVFRQGDNFTVKDLNVFCPKAFAGIGKCLPDTVVDRSIPIRLKRKPRGSGTERFVRRVVAALGAQLKSEIEAWATVGVVGVLKEAYPALPEELSDRQQDGAEPLLAIADLIGEPWATKLRRALVEICASGQVANYSASTQLLADIQDVFDSKGVDRVSSMGLVTALCEIETSPWGEYSKGRPLTAIGLARLLEKYDVTPRTVRGGDLTFKGYDRAWFEEAWDLYLAPSSPDTPYRPVTPSQAGLTSTKYGASRSESTRHTEMNVTVEKREIAAKTLGCYDVTAQSPIAEGKGDGEASQNDIWPTEPRPAAKGGVTCDKCGDLFGSTGGFKAHIAQGRCVAKSNEVGR
jgi:hypothetical protein